MSPNPRFFAQTGTRDFLRFGSLALTLGLAGCQTPLPAAAPSPPPAAETIRALPEETPIADATRYDIDPGLADVRLLVYRAGPLARIGHNHVIQARNVHGDVLLAPDMRQSRFSMEIPVADFQVDNGDTRQVEGEEFLAQPDDEAISGTVANLLGEHVLDADKYPTITVRSVALSGPDWGMDVIARIRMHGVERDVTVPTAVARDDDTLIVTSTFTIRQSDFGITPLSVLGGAVQVDDTVKVRVRLVAQKHGQRPEIDAWSNAVAAIPPGYAPSW